MLFSKQSNITSGLKIVNQPHTVSGDDTAAYTVVQ